MAMDNVAKDDVISTLRGENSKLHDKLKVEAESKATVRAHKDTQPL